ncbi:MAG: hypothetical protein P8016_00370 [Sedimentisphaerales bacterium]
MKRGTVSLAAVCILLIFNSAYAIEVYEPGYTVEILAVYPQSIATRGLAVDGVGNLYATHYPPGFVWRIAPDGAAREFGAIEYPRGITWTGGTSFGEYLYVVDFETFRGDIMRLDLSGAVSHFTSLSGDGPTSIALDRTGDYGGLLYVTTRGDDCIYRIDTQGNESIFSSFPYSRNGGGPLSLAFDTTGNYGGLLYLANTYDPGNEDVTGLFSLDTEGHPARFTEDLIQAGSIAFAPDCGFSEYMYVIGKETYDSPRKLWRIDPEGHASVFASDCQEIIFGPDGSLFVSEFSAESGLVTISRIRNKSYYIDAANGNDSNSGTNSQSAFATIQKGIDTAPEGYSVLVRPGIYNDTIDFKGKAITVQGLADSDGVPVLEVPNTFAVSFVSNEGPDSVLKNVVIKNSYIGILLVESSPTISNVTIVDNDYGIRAYSAANPDISNCIFWNNSESDLSGCEARYSWVQNQIDTSEGSISGLLYYWPIDETGSSSIKDVVSGADGDINGATWTSGMAGAALSFDGIDDYVDCGVSTSYMLNQDISFSTWVNRNAEQQAIFVIEGGPDDLGRNNALFYLGVTSGGRLKYIHEYGPGENEEYDFGVVPQGLWTHIAIVRDSISKTVTAYFNGFEDNTFHYINQPANSSFELKMTLGSRSTGVHNFEGLIDETIVFERVLSYDEIEQIYSNGISFDFSHPMFVDPNNADYHLLSERGRYWPEHDVWVLDKVSSPCIDTGDPSTDAANEPMPNGGSINMGAYGGTIYASMSEMPFPNPDFNNDGNIDESDLADLVDLWLAAAGWLQ